MLKVDDSLNISEDIGGRETLRKRLENVLLDLLLKLLYQKVPWS
jgi:hypothetical protein